MGALLLLVGFFLEEAAAGALGYQYTHGCVVCSGGWALVCLVPENVFPLF